ncbi:SDR family oxidoreductase [Pseudoalteromonas fenneropenaei]|uniref:SDR family oxidoreductase n=1 Tax=Pseudoalteromonas fenneropenaei TaxID=1737459 RepID=A0ABV7CHQ1_9GAMM
MRLAGKVALITGAAQGIGLQIARRFAEAGAFVLLSDIQSFSAVIRSEFNSAQADFVTLDVTDETQWQAVKEDIANRFGGLDILVNNAGVTGFSDFPERHDPEHFTLPAWRHVHSVNSEGVALGCKYAIALMKGRKAASIVNISSRSGLVGIPAAAAYAASKAAVRNHSKSVALYCAEQGYPIRCNAIHPGAILTPMWEPMLPQEPKARAAAIAAIAKDVPLATMGDVDDVAYAALYLASDEAKYVTGIELNVDGGLLAGTAARPQQQ